MKTFARLFFPLLFALLVSVSFSGCARYQLGTGAKLGFRTLFIAPVASETLLAQGRSQVSLRLREVFLRDSRVELVSSEEQAEATLQLTLKHFGREARVSRADDTALARKFALSLTVLLELRQADGRVLLSRELLVQRENYIDSGQLQSEYEMLPQLAEQVAQQALHAVLDTW